MAEAGISARTARRPLATACIFATACAFVAAADPAAVSASSQPSAASPFRRPSRLSPPSAAAVPPSSAASAAALSARGGAAASSSFFGRRRRDAALQAPGGPGDLDSGDGDGNGDGSADTAAMHRSDTAAESAATAAADAVDEDMHELTEVLGAAVEADAEAGGKGDGSGGAAPLSSVMGVGEAAAAARQWQGQGQGPREVSRVIQITASVRHAFGQSLSSSLNALLPVLKTERAQFAAMSAMMFLFIYVFTTVRDTKDALVVSHCGAEAIPFLKLYGVVPAAALFLVLYTKASNVLGRQALFYVTLVPFFVFYSVFAFVLYPRRDAIHFLPKAAASVVDAVVDASASEAGGEAAAAASAAATAVAATPGPLSLLRYWSYSLYFIVSELWASAGVPLLFWQCANDVTSLGQAKRFYPLLAVAGNLAPIVSGKVMAGLVADGGLTFQSTLQRLASIKMYACVGIVVLYNLVYDLADKRQRVEDKMQVNAMLKGAKKGDTIEVEVKFGGKDAPRAKPTLRESLEELAQSSELKSMATIVICYNVCIELTEVLWKALLRRTYTDESSYMGFMATFSQTVGWFTIIMQLAAGPIIRGIGWKGAAMLVPLSMGALALWFFGSAVAADEPGNASALATALLIGTVQNVVSKVTKYSLFDPTKEMAYIPLGPEAKGKGKAAVDVMGARLGRSVGSAAQQILVLATSGSIIECAPVLGFIYMTAIGFWANAASSLGKLFEEPSEDDTDGAASGLAGLVQVKVDSSNGRIVSVEAERSR